VIVSCYFLPQPRTPDYREKQIRLTKNDYTVSECDSTCQEALCAKKMDILRH